MRECVTLGADGVCTGGQVYWTATEVNELGAVTKTSLGNGLETLTSYNRAGGTVTGIQATAGSTDVQDLTFAWDMAGNLTSRTDMLINGANGGYQQTFAYDSLHRLKTVSTDYNIISGDDPIVRHTHYQANGNIACRDVVSETDCGGAATYAYSTAHPHAVEYGPNSATAYTYDLNGSMLTGPNREIAWTTFNKPELICAGSIDDVTGDCDTATWSAFKYNPDRARYAQVTAQKTTYYAGALYERVVDNATGEALHRYHIFAGGSAVAVYTCTDHCGEDPEGDTADGTRDETLYLLRDHLGSISVTVDGKGDVVDRFHYTAWGEQQVWNDTTDVFDAYVPPPDERHTRGFTGHEMLSELGLVHMNGRIYDQNIGRFISADPFVQFPESTQGYNRYTYVGNNPLSYTDPSGYFLKDLVKTAIGVVAMVYLGPIAGGAISGYLSTGTLKGAVLGMIGGAMAYGIGEAFSVAANGAALTAGQAFGKAMLHGISQGALSKAGGGRFGDGFLGGFSSSLLGPAMKRAGPIGGTVMAAAVGGTVSVIGGGKFKNGALSAAFVHAFNELLHPTASSEVEALDKSPEIDGSAPLNAAGQEVDYSDCGGGSACVVKNQGVRSELSKLNRALAADVNGHVSVSGGDRYYDAERGGSVSHSTDQVVTSTKGFHNDELGNRAVDIRFDETNLTREQVIPYIEGNTGFRVLRNYGQYGVSNQGHIHLTCNTSACVR